MDARQAALAAAGSAIGGLARYLLASLFSRSEFPWGVLIVNVVGCFLIGFLIFGGMSGGWMPLNLRIFLAIGILGGFTTMSAFTFDTILLAERNALAALGNVLLTVGLCLGATWLGRVLAVRAWPAPTG